MTIHTDQLANRLEELYAGFVERIVSMNSALTCGHGKSSNDAFLLRSFLSIRREGCEDEVSVTVDVHALSDVISIESDVCFDDGRIILEGPSARITSINEVGQSSEVDAWLLQFQNFLRTSEAIISDALG